MPPEIISKLAAALAVVLSRADVKAKFAGAGAKVRSAGPNEFAAFVKADSERWAILIKERKLQLA
jgi:tripartite-type tricarboxylate transporter receptor subunit TctC